MSGQRQVISGGVRQGRTPDQKSNFVQTCNLLSQYIKEKGSLKDLNLEIGGKVESLDTLGKKFNPYILFFLTSHIYTSICFLSYSQIHEFGLQKKSNLAKITLLID